MTIREAITAADSLRPNTLADAAKLQWLRQLDGQLRAGVVALHTADGAPGTGADVSTADDTALLAEEPYSALYLYWLMAQTDLALGEIARYDNDMLLYNSAAAEYAAHYKAQHMPVRRGQFCV